MAARSTALFLAVSLLAASGCSGASDKAPKKGSGDPKADAEPKKDGVAPKDDEGGLEALQGTWLMVAYGAKGDPTEPASDDKEPWVIKGTKLTYYDNIQRNDIKLAADLKVDPGQKPAHIDLAIKGKWKGKEMEWTTHGIYSLKGDELTVCVPEKFDPWEPENRPKEFKSTKPPPGKGSGFSVYVLKKK